MGMRQSVGGRRSVMLYFGVAGVLILAVALAAIVFVVAPERERRQQAEAQQAQATATEEARLAEVERSYQAGIAFAEAGDWEKAVEEFTEVITLEPDHGDVATRLAEARNKVTSANATLTAEAAATATAETEAVYQRGLGYLNLERWDQAKAAFEEVIAVDPNYKDIQARLAEVDAQLAELTPTSTSTPSATVTPTATTRPTGTPTVSPLSEIVEVRADRDWQDTGVYVREGQILEITYLRGEWSQCAEHGCPYVDANGDPDIPLDWGDNVVAGCQHGALIARISNAMPFCVGGSLTQQIESSGTVHLRTNDKRTADNDGSIMVQVQTRQ